MEDRLALILEREKTEREQRRYLRLKGLAKLHLDATIEDRESDRHALDSVIGIKLNH